MCPGIPGSCKKPGGKNGFNPGGRRIPAAALLPLAVAAEILIPPAVVNTGCLKLKGDPAEKVAPNAGYIDATAAAAIEFDIDVGIVLLGKIEEVPDSVDGGLGDSDDFPRLLEEDTDVELEDVGVDKVPLLIATTELPPKLGAGDTLCPDLELGDSGRWFITERLAIEDVSGLPPPRFGDEFLRFSEAVAAASIACCCFKACSVDANKLEIEFDDSLSVGFNKLCVRLGIPDSFAAASRDAKLGVDPETALFWGGSVWRFR